MINLPPAKTRMLSTPASRRGNMRHRILTGVLIQCGIAAALVSQEPVAKTKADPSSTVIVRGKLVDETGAAVADAIFTSSWGHRCKCAWVGLPFS